MKTDSEGWRGKTRIQESQVLVIGDSFAFGFGVDDKRAYFSINDSKLHIKAIGSPGYNMVQEVIWMRQLAAHLRDKMVVWFICLSNDLYDNLLPNLHHYRMPFVRQVNGTRSWEIVTDHISANKWPLNFEESSRVHEKFAGTFGTNFLSQRAYGACEFLIKEARSICRQAGGQLVVFTVPWAIQLDRRNWKRREATFKNGEAFDPQLPDRKIGTICSKLGVSFVAGKDYLEACDHIPDEGHWNERGHKRVAELLWKLSHQYAWEATGRVAKMSLGMDGTG